MSGADLQLDDFVDFFKAIHDGYEPFRWQRRLLTTVVETGRWPEHIVAPTGAGKTAVIEVHVFAVALMASGAPVRVPRRLALVVDRRALVDDQYEHAREVAKLLHSPTQPVLARMAAALRTLATGRDSEPAAPVRVVRLRGGVPAPLGWRDDPTRCMVICATPDMWGSRLLFRGYGSANRARPRETGLLATDAVVVVDEAHLARQLLTTARRVAVLREVAERALPVPGLHVVETTATPGDVTGAAVGVEPGDLAHEPVLAARLTTPKPVELLELPAWPLPRRGPDRTQGLDLIADKAVELRERYGPTVGCFVNTVPTAIHLAQVLEDRGHQVVLLCGRMRQHDVDRIRTAYPGLLSIDGDRDVDFVVTTQTLEVGSDLDWSAAVTELAPATALAQRAGRVNRRGRRTDTRVVVAVPAAELTDKEAGAALPYQVADLNEALAWVRRRATDERGLAPWALRDDRPPAQSPSRPLWQRLELADAWHLARTSDQLAAEPELDLWLSDDLEPDLDVGVVVRHRLPEDAVAAVRALPPRDYETFPATMGTARRMLERLVSGADHGAELPRPVLVRGGEVSWFDAGDRLRPGDVLVVDDRVPAFLTLGATGVPVLDMDGGDRARDVLEDVSEPDGPRPGRVVLRLGQGSLFDHPEPDSPYAPPEVQEAATALFGEAVDAYRTLSPVPARRVIADRLEALVKLEPKLKDHLAPVVALLRMAAKHSELILRTDADDDPLWLVVRDNRRLARDEDIRQLWTPNETPVPLATHAGAVADRAGRIAETLSLDAEVAALLHRAGLHHDDGKGDPRFQIVLGAGEADPPLAKSRAMGSREAARLRDSSGLPSRWRHEQLSVVRAWEALSDLSEADRRLVARLVGTSHGHGRHDFPHTTAGLLDETPPDGSEPVAVQLFDHGGWDELIETTHREWGVWGSAYLEALLRAADSQVSAEGS